MRRAVIVPATAVLLVAGCGNEQTRSPDLGRAAAPTQFRAARFEQAGVELKVPQNWAAEPADRPQVATLSSGDAQVAIWRYERSEPLPETRAQLQSARDELVKRVRARDATFRVTNTRVVIKPRLRAVEIVGVGTNQGTQRKVRSLHAYGHKAEIVLDAFAPPDAFARADRLAFGPMTRSLRLTKPRT